MFRTSPEAQQKSASFLSTFFMLDKEVEPSEAMQSRLEKLAGGMDQKLPKRGYIKH